MYYLWFVVVDFVDVMVVVFVYYVELFVFGIVLDGMVDVIQGGVWVYCVDVVLYGFVCGFYQVVGYY